MNVAQKYFHELCEDRPIEYAGLMFYPLELRYFALYQSARPAIELMLASLPPKLARLNWFDCLGELDREAKSGGLQTHFLTSFLALLDAALRLNARQDPRRFITSSGEDGRIKAVICTQDAMPVMLSASQLCEVRQILAAQNGYEIPNEAWNPELVRAQEHLRRRNGIQGGGDLSEIVYSLAAATGHRARDIWGWSIREFNAMTEAVDRQFLFKLYAAAELSGQVKFKHGNPVPTWQYTVKGDLPRGFQKLSDLEADSKGLLSTETNNNKE